MSGRWNRVCFRLVGGSNRMKRPRKGRQTFFSEMDIAEAAQGMGFLSRDK